MQKIELALISELGNIGVNIRTNSKPIVHHSGFLSAKNRSRFNVFGLCSPLHFNQCLFVKGKRIRDQINVGLGLNLYSQCLLPT